jgi:antitoxin VapB
MAKPKQRRRRTSKPKQRAKVFWTGRSQAVRLPKEFRFDCDSVLIRREGTKVILEPDLGWPDGWVESFTGIDDWERPPQGEYEKRVELKL